jgi:hypothetical protein
MIKKFYLVLLAGLVLLVTCQQKEAPQKPNIILILADDLGYMDVQAYAVKTLGTAKSKMYYETPNIDRLVEEGFSFSRAYARQVCRQNRIHNGYPPL